MIKPMRDLIGYWSEEISLNWIIAGVLCVFMINAGMNGMMGLATGGGGVMSVMYAAAFVAIAAVGAYAATAQADVPADSLKKYLLWLLVVLQLCLGQMAGWQTLGLTLERGANQMVDQADERGVVKGQLARFRAERAAIGVVPETVAALSARMALERSKTSRQYPDGQGPEWTKTKVLYEQAKRARELDDLIAAQTQKPIGDISNPDVVFEVPAVLASTAATYISGKATAVSTSDVRFGWKVFLVALLEFVATLGFWLFSVGPRRPPAVPVYAGDAGMFDPALLPAPPRRQRLTHERGAAPDGGPHGASHAGSHTVPGADIHALRPAGPVMGSAPHGGSSTNNIYVGNEPKRQNLPPRVAAMRNAG